ncbi:MAG: fibronectin type III domain-containing protein [Caldisericia bacterium]|nr:fibronectin type III domain-containing protein [Caldisericia bacterium]
MRKLIPLICAMLLLQMIPQHDSQALSLTTKALAMMSETGTQASIDVTLPVEPIGSPKFTADIKSEEKIVWDSGINADFPVDVDKVYISHDVQYINVRITLNAKLEDISGDPFISIAMDTDLNPTTGMPKLYQRSYNMGGEDFFARFSTAYGDQKFVIDRWDQSSSDTVETGGLANAKASGKEIKFSIPRLAIGDPCKLDFKVVARTYQTVEPDLSPEHIIYDLTGTTAVSGWKVEKIDTKRYLVTSPVINQTGIEHVNLVWDNIVLPITRYAVNAATNPDAVVWSNQPQVGKHLFMTRVEVFEDDENLKFVFNFANSLKGMGDCDLKIWAMLDTDGKPNVGFEGIKFGDNYEDYIMEVATESRAVRTKLYTASKGMGYNQPSLNDGTLDFEKGICQMTVKKNRIGSPDKIRAKFACGAFKAVEADWDCSTKNELPGKLMYLQYQTLYSEPARGYPLDIRKVECISDTANLYMRITVSNLDKGSVTVWVDQDANPLTGIPKTAGNPAGIDNTIELTKTLGFVYRFNPDGTKTKTGDFLGIRYGDGRLSFPVPLKLLANPKTIRFHVTASDGSAKVAHTLWYLQYGQDEQQSCNENLDVTAAVENGSVKLSWKTKVENPLGWYVYKRDNDETYNRITNTPVTEASFVDNAVEWGKYYQYKVMTICSDGGKSELSNSAGIYVKSDKPQAKIQIDKTILDFGTRRQTKNICDGFTVKNLGPGAVDLAVTTESPSLSATVESLHVEEGQSKRVNVCILENLQPGSWQSSVTVATKELAVVVPVKVDVQASNIADRVVNNLKAVPGAQSLMITWEKPAYNVEQATGYKVDIEETYMLKVMSKTSKTLDASTTSLKLDNLDFETIYTITVTPYYGKTLALPSTVQAQPLAPNISIIMKVGSKEAIVDGKAISISGTPFIDSKTGKTMVPFRFIAESLKCTVAYEARTKMITIKRGWKSVVLVVGSPEAVVSGMKVQVSPPPVVKNGTTFVPVRFVADAFQAETTWNASTKQVGIYFPYGYRP